MTENIIIQNIRNGMSFRNPGQFPNLTFTPLSADPDRKQMKVRCTDTPTGYNHSERWDDEDWNKAISGFLNGTYVFA